MLLPINEINKSENRYYAVEDLKPKGLFVDLAEEMGLGDVDPEIIQDNIQESKENLAKRKAMIRSSSHEPVEFAFERAIGKNDSVYSNFVELIHLAKQKVGRIVVKEGARDLGFATGFMVSENLLLTNWHVFQNQEDVGDSQVQFFYEYNAFGSPSQAISFKLDPKLFFHSHQDLDYCFVGVSPQDLTGAKNIKDIGYLFLDPGLGKLRHQGKEALNIIHHPNGDYKQLSIRENLFEKITPISIWYKADTAPGSSGSPVFNDQWQVVALHHMGVAKKNADGQYLDKDDKVIAPNGGKIDESKVVWVANEGIRISVIMNDLFSKYANDPVVNGMMVKPVTEILTSPKETPENDNFKKPSNTNPMESNQVNISFPASLVERNGVINININQGVSSNPVPKPTSRNSPESSAEDSLLLESKRLEQNIDFVACKGYQSRFLGQSHQIAFPQPQASIKKFIAKIIGTDAILLNYHNYSCIFHSLRMMPLISGINIDGDPLKRQDKTEREDSWLRDRRLGFDIQLDNDFYEKSGFDRGHMSRREDANWGNTPEDAKRNADMTCFFTNACPQVAQINRSNSGKDKGLWGKLENVVLEKGASLENGQTAKISVFNGPIFKDDDPVFRGIQIPLDFFKIVLWLTDTGDLRATAFKLSQQELLGDIDFEQLDFDQNITFKEFQCSIKSLQKETKIDFSDFFKFDTFEGPEGNDLPLNSAELATHITKHRKNA